MGATTFLARTSFMAMAAVVLMACQGPDSSTPQQGAKQAATAIEIPKVDIAAIAKMSPTELMESATAQSHQLADVLSTVKDSASAEVAVAQIRVLGPQLNAVGERLQSFQEDDMKMSLKTMNTMQAFAEAQIRIFEQTGRIAKDHPELRDIIAASFEDIDINFQ